MAKKQNELQFGQVPLPQALKQYSLSKLNWSGLNRRQVIDTGALSMECNISTAEAPYLTPSQSRADILSPEAERHVRSRQNIVQAILQKWMLHGLVGIPGCKEAL